MKPEERRKKLLRVIEAVDKMMNDENCDPKIKEDISVLKMDMQDDFFSVVVLGEFKHGKSTFVNALLGEDLLISDTLPETATIQAVMYSEEKKIQVLYHDGTKQNGPLTKEFLMQFSAKSQENASKIKYIKIGYPTAIINEKVVLIDTPGVSDMNEQRVKVTYDFIPKANVVLFVLDATSPMKRSEKEFIEEHLLKQGISKIIFVLNKIDLFDDEEEDVEEYLETVKGRIKEAFKDNDQLSEIQLFPVSSYLAIKGIENNNEQMIKDSNILEVKQKIGEIIKKGDLEQVKLDRYKERLHRILSYWKGQTEREVALYQSDINSLKCQLDNLQKIKEESLGKYNVIDTYVDREKEFLFSLLAKSMNKFYYDLTDDIEYEIERYQREDFKNFIERDIPHTVKKRTEIWMNSHLNGVDRMLTQLESRLSEALSQYFNKKVFINTVSEEIYIKPCLQMTVNDISNAGISAGVISAAGAMALMMAGGGMLMPMVSMAVFPVLRQKFLKDSLDREKESVLPTVRNELRQYVYYLQQEIEKNIDVRVADIKYCVQNNYEKFIQGYMRNMEKCLNDKKSQEASVLDIVKVKENNHNCISLLIEKTNVL